MNHPCDFTVLSRQGRAALDQVQINLGHESLETTQRYLGEDLDDPHALATTSGSTPA